MLEAITMSTWLEIGVSEHFLDPVVLTHSDCFHERWDHFVCKEVRILLYTMCRKCKLMFDMTMPCSPDRCEVVLLHPLVVKSSVDKAALIFSCSIHDRDGVVLTSRKYGREGGSSKPGRTS